MLSLKKVERDKDIYRYFAQDEKKIIECLQNDGFLKPLKKCPKCCNQQLLYHNTRLKGHYGAYCKKCKKFKCLTEGTFFEGTHLSFEDAFVSLWFWCCHVSSGDVAKVTGITREAVVQYHRYFRDIASWKILNMPQLELGGKGKLVQIDESVITRRKFNRGRGVRKCQKEKWVLGIYDVERKLGIVLYVVLRDKATLVPLIRQHVIEGSEVWTDGWAAYKGLPRWYIHKTVNHSKEFKSADGVCTNGVEGYWSRLKFFCRHTCVLRSKLLAEHIDEFMYRQHFRGSPAKRFASFIEHMQERYPI